MEEGLALNFRNKIQQQLNPSGPTAQNQAEVSRLRDYPESWSPEGQIQIVERRLAAKKRMEEGLA